MRNRKIQYAFGIFMLLHFGLLVLSIETKIFEGSIFEAFGATVIAIPYYFQKIGIEIFVDDALNGSGWPQLNVLGWLLSILFWALVYWVVSFVIVHLATKYNSR